MLDKRRDEGEKIEIFCFYEEYGLNGIGEVRSWSECVRLSHG
jgi:hypothetical protein